MWKIELKRENNTRFWNVMVCFWQNFTVSEELSASIFRVNFSVPFQRIVYFTVIAMRTSNPTKLKTVGNPSKVPTEDSW
jgi:hypothetical protein